MLITDQHPNNRSITVAVLGAPNVGKSSLINYLLGMNLSVVTSRPQTTRNRYHCVFTVDHTEIILVDTPGLHRSNKEFNKRLNQQAREGSEGADLNLLIIDLSGEVMQQFFDFKENFGRELAPTWIVFSKADLIENVEALPLTEVVEKARELLPEIEKHFVISAKNGDNVHLLTGAICDRAPSSPHLYMDGSVSNKHERFFVTEYIREQVFNLIKEEVPYEVAVVVEEYEDYREKNIPNKVGTSISAAILVKNPAQRGILVGAGGSMIKKIGMAARERIEEMVGGQVFLKLHVKVSENWFSNNFVLEEIGLPRALDSNRVWRK